MLIEPGCFGQYLYRFGKLADSMMRSTPCLNVIKKKEGAGTDYWKRTGSRFSRRGYVKIQEGLASDSGVCWGSLVHKRSGRRRLTERRKR